MINKKRMRKFRCNVYTQGKMCEWQKIVENTHDTEEENEREKSNCSFHSLAVLLYVRCDMLNIKQKCHLFNEKVKTKLSAKNYKRNSKIITPYLQVIWTVFVCDIIPSNISLFCVEGRKFPIETERVFACKNFCQHQ